MHFFNAFALLHGFLPWFLIRCVLLCIKVDRFQRIVEYLGLMEKVTFPGMCWLQICQMLAIFHEDKF